MLGLITISVGFCLLAVNVLGISPVISFPGGFGIDLGVLSTVVPLEKARFTSRGSIYSSSFAYGRTFNAVNLTDGLTVLREAAPWWSCWLWLPWRFDMAR